MKYNLLGLFAAAAALLTTACERDPLSDAVTDDSDYVAVTFSIQPEGLATTTRAEDADPTKSEGNVHYSTRHISDGTKADILVYAVYDEDGELLTEFGQVERGGDSCVLPDGTALGKGQTCEKIDQFPHKITLNVKRNKTYKIAFWAQSSSCKAYKVDDLKQVQIHYAEMPFDDDMEAEDAMEVDDDMEKTDLNASSTPNNDEMRDAFCKVETLEIKNKLVNNRTILLYRPLAQINVGTTGYDYETIVQDREMNYAYTRIQIATAARYLNVVEDKIEIGTQDKESVMEFGWALIPAYDNAAWAKEKGATDAILNYISDESISCEYLQKTYSWEEFLKVEIYDKSDENNPVENAMDVDDSGKYFKYAGLENNNKKTETFKYLSMCYVLAASNDDNGDGKYDPSSFNRVRVWIARDKNGKDPKEIVDLTNVPATRNWRTNIVGNILTTDVPFQIKLDPIYAGDYNGFYEDGATSWSGPLNGLNGGAFYDAENDEILISNVDGLLWFQQMVNGDLVYSVDNNSSIGEKAVAGESLKYYDEDGKEHTFDEKDAPSYFKGISDPTEDLEEGTPEYEEAALLKARILKATHQEKNKSYNAETSSWPKHNNFHFVGTKENGDPDPAKVKLVADIDLSGIEWLGIGFDCKSEQTSDMLGDNDKDNRTDDDNHKRHWSKADHRGFFGEFNGNGHTVSNLKTKRFSLNVHPASLQNGSAGPYDAVQWYARGFFGQLGGTAEVKDLTLRNVDIYGFNYVGGIAGAAIGVEGKGSKKGTEINITNCVVDGGTIETVPMYRGDAESNTGSGQKQNRTYSRGVNTGGIVGLYNASGSVTGCEVRNLSISGYRTTGGIVGGIANYYDAYDNSDNGDFKKVQRINTGSEIKMASLSNNAIYNTTILSDHFKPFDTMKIGKYEYQENKVTVASIEWACGFAWMPQYSSYVHKLVGGEFGCDSNNDPGISDYVTTVSGNSPDGCQVIDYACDLIWDRDKRAIYGRIVEIENAPVEVLPVLNNWFVDVVNVKSNLIGAAKLYKRYETYSVPMFSSNDTKYSVMWNLPNNYKINWKTDFGKVGMRVGAITLDGENHALSVREVTGKNDCAMQISSCNRTVFMTKDTPNPNWDKEASTTVENFTVRGNPYAFTGICLSPNECMNAITLDNISVYDVYQTIALDQMGSDNGSVWPKEITPSSVDLTISNSDLRGYTVPGKGWKSVKYENTIFEKGAYINSAAADQDKRYTCQVDVDGTEFDGCTFKAPFIIEINAENVTFTNCTVDGQRKSTIDMPEGTKKIEVADDGSVTYYNAAGAPIEA